MSGRCATCAVELGRGRSFWKPVRCAETSAPPRSTARGAVERRICAICREPFCVRPHRPHIYCSPACRSAAGSWNSQCLIEQDGRWFITCRDGSHIAYARAIAELTIGRRLQPGEVVHHINGNPSDDRPENLQVLTRAEHMAVHRNDLERARAAARVAA